MEVTLVDFMGDDIRVANAARVSFHKETQWDPKSNELPMSDQKLINYLAKHNHWTPFSHVMVTMREKVPIFVARQRFKHMVGFTYNEVSRRYVDDTPEFFVPDKWRARPEGSVKQGSGTEEVKEIFNFIDREFVNRWDTPKTDTIKNSYEWFLEVAEKFYNTMIEAGVAPEQARMVLPQSMYTEYYVTGSLAAWARAYKLRVDSHAQKEIQELADMWEQIIGNIPELEHSWKALITW